MSLCSVVMVAHRTGPVLYASVRSALKQPNLAELILVSQGNPPDMLARLQQISLGEPRLKIIQGEEAGYAAGCNLGAKMAGAEYLLLLDADCLLPPDATASLIRTLGEIENAMLAGAKIVYPDNQERCGCRRAWLTPASAIGQATGLHRWTKLPKLNLNDRPMPDKTHEMPIVSGACFCIRRVDYASLHGMDVHISSPADIADLCLRVYKNGGRVALAPDVVVAQLPPADGKTTPRAVDWAKTRGYIRYFRKHFAKESFPGAVSLIAAGLVARFLWRNVSAAARRRLHGARRLLHTTVAKRLMILASGLADLPQKQDWEDRTVLVTGATSQIGLCVIRRLLASGASVLAVSRGDEIPFKHEELRWVRGDLSDPGFSLQGYLIDVAIHCAPLWRLPPVVGLLAEAEVSRVVAFGSTSVFGKALSRNAYERGLVENLSRAERDIAERCADREIAWTILRPTLIYGVGLDLGVTALAKHIDRFGRTCVYPPAFGKRQPVHADDLALAALQAADCETAHGKCYNLSGGEILTYREMLERLFSLCRRGIRIHETTLLPFLLDAAGLLTRRPRINGEIARRMNDDLIFFHEDAHADFGFRPRPFLSGGMKDIEGY